MFVDGPIQLPVELTTAVVPTVSPFFTMNADDVAKIHYPLEAGYCYTAISFAIDLTTVTEFAGVISTLRVPEVIDASKVPKEAPLLTSPY